MRMNVRFFNGTKEQYLNLATHNPLGLYFCEDTGEMFKGDILITDGTRIIPTFADLPEFHCAADGVIYYTLDTQNGYLLNQDRDGWIPIINSNSEETKQELKDYIDEKLGTISGGTLDGGEI